MIIAERKGTKKETGDVPWLAPKEKEEEQEDTKTGVSQSGSVIAGIRAGKYTPDGTTNLKVLNKRCAQQNVYKNTSDS